MNANDFAQPDKVGAWVFDHKTEHNLIYKNGSKMAIISESEVSIGIARPAGANIGKYKVNSFEEGINILKDK